MPLGTARELVGRAVEGPRLGRGPVAGIRDGCAAVEDVFRGRGTFGGGISSDVDGLDWPRDAGRPSLNAEASSGFSDPFFKLSSEAFNEKDGTLGSNLVLRAFGVESGDSSSARESMAIEGGEADSGESTGVSFAPSPSSSPFFDAWFPSDWSCGLGRGVARPELRGIFAHIADACL